MTASDLEFWKAKMTLEVREARKHLALTWMSLFLLTPDKKTHAVRSRMAAIEEKLRRWV